MNYKDYKRQVKLTEVLGKPLECDYLVIDKFVKLDTLEKNSPVDGYTYYSNNNGLLFIFGNFGLLFFYVYNYDDPIMDVFKNSFIGVSFIADLINDKFDFEKVDSWSIHIKNDGLEWF